MTTASLWRTAAVELLDQHGQSIATVPAHCVEKDVLRFEASPDHVERAWTMRALDADGNLLDSAPTPVARGMRELGEALQVAFDAAEVPHAPE